MSILPIAKGLAFVDSLTSDAQTQLDNAQPKDDDLVAIAALAGTSGLLRKTGSNTWVLDTSVFLTNNQNITFTGDATGSGATAVTLTLANSGVVAGSYGNSTNIPAISVDAKGRVTGVTNTPVSIPSGSLTFTGDVTGTGTTGSSTALTLSNTGITAGTYTKVTMDAKGRATSGTSLSAADIPSLDASKLTTGTFAEDRLSVGSSTVRGALKLFSDTVQSVVANAISSIASRTYGLQLNSSGQLVVNVPWTDTVYNHPNSGVTASTYKSVTVDAQGHVTGGTNPTTLAGYGITDAASSSHNHSLDSLSNVTITSNTSGEILKWSGTAWINNTLAEAGIQPAGSYLTGNQTITFSGDASGSGSTAVTLTLANSGVTAGTYNNSATAVKPLVIDAKGRVTGVGADVTITPSWSNITSKPTTLAGYGITDAQALDADLTAIAALAGTTGLLRKTAANTWSLDTTAYTANLGTVTSVGLSLPSIFTVTNSPVTTSGTLTGTLASQNANLVFASPNGATGTPTFRSLVAADIPSLDTSKLTSGILDVARGGTGIASYAIGDLVVASGATTLSKIPGVAIGSVLLSGGVNLPPIYGKVGLTTHISGTLAVANGGTGVTTSTGSGSVVLSVSPSLTTPNIGVATGTSFNSITGLASVAPLVAGTAAVGTSTLVARQDHVHPAQTSVSGNAGTATKLGTARTIAVTGDATGTATSFDGSANISINITSINGGTY